MGVLKYKNFIGSVEYSETDKILFGKVLGIRGLISYEGQNVEELEQDFRAGQDLRRELEAAGERYRNEREERVRAARESYSRGVGLKRSEIERRYRRPEPEVGLAGVEGVGLSVDRGGVSAGDQLGRGVVPGQGHRRELGRDLTPEQDIGAVGSEGRKIGTVDVRREEAAMREGVASENGI
jgi:predicted HicB family RNase H-like nuclease